MASGSGGGQGGPIPIDHVALSVTDIALARRLLAGCFGLTELLERRVEGPQMEVSIMAAEHMSIELLALDPEQAPELHALTPHLAFRVRDLGDTTRLLTEFGVKWQDDEPMRVGETLNLWSDPTTSAGMVIQLVCSA